MTTSSTSQARDRRWPSLEISQGMARQVASGHPWLFADVVPREFDAGHGSFVRLTRRGRHLGFALLDRQSPIALRVVSRGDDPPPGPNLWRRRLDAARALRERVVDQTATDMHRAVHGEGDDVPGLVVDRYGDWLVVQLDSTAWLERLDEFSAALAAAYRPRGVLLKKVRGDEAARVLLGEAPPELIVGQEHGMKLGVDVRRGQKTGMFLDQRENRRLVRGVARDLDVLNLFSYTGGFTVAAGLGGARSLVSVDAAAAAIEAVSRNLDLNHVRVPSEVVREDAFVFLEGAVQEHRSYDLVIVDPPSFARRARDVEAARSGYARLNELAMRCVRDGGLLASGSCSSHLTYDDFVDILARAARSSRRRLRVVDRRGEPADHPVPLAFFEGRYLKFVLAVVEHS